MKAKILIAAIIILLMIGLGVFWQRSKMSLTTSTTTSKPTPSASATSLVSSPEPSQTPLASASANIQVTKPLPNEKVNIPIIIEGQARVFENQFNYKVKDFDGTVLVQGSAYANSPDVGQFGPFKITVSVKPKGSSGTIEVFDYSPKDGSEIDMVSVPVKF